jgi:hypothetical protein
MWKQMRSAVMRKVTLSFIQDHGKWKIIHESVAFSYLEQWNLTRISLGWHFQLNRQGARRQWSVHFAASFSFPLFMGLKSLALFVHFHPLISKGCRNLGLIFNAFRVHLVSIWANVIIMFDGLIENEIVAWHVQNRIYIKILSTFCTGVEADSIGLNANAKIKY